jgi:pre-mRNA-splicing factor CDC5/CEF1
LQDRKYKGINYNRELAFERMVPDFVHETTGEEPEPDKKISNVSL